MSLTQETGSLKSSMTAAGPRRESNSPRYCVSRWYPEVDQRAASRSACRPSGTHSNPQGISSKLVGSSARWIRTSKVRGRLRYATPSAFDMAWLRCFASQSTAPSSWTRRPYFAVPGRFLANGATVDVQTPRPGAVGCVAPRGDATTPYRGRRGCVAARHSPRHPFDGALFVDEVRPGRCRTPKAPRVGGPSCRGA